MFELYPINQASFRLITEDGAYTAWSDDCFVLTGDGIDVRDANHVPRFTIACADPTDRAQRFAQIMAHLRAMAMATAPAPRGRRPWLTKRTRWVAGACAAVSILLGLLMMVLLTVPPPPAPVIVGGSSAALAANTLDPLPLRVEPGREALPGSFVIRPDEGDEALGARGSAPH